MEMEFSKGKIVFEKELSDLDKFVLDFLSILKSTKIRYVIVSGYVSILFGRSRATEDIDLFIEPLSRTRFEEFMAKAGENGMWALNSSEMDELFSMLSDGLAIRMAEIGKAIPNFELKFPKKDTDFLSLDNPVKIVIKGNEILISPIEIQLAYKLYLGSEKDIEDAVHIYQIFKEKLDRNLLNNMIQKLKVKDRAEQYGIK